MKFLDLLRFQFGNSAVINRLSKHPKILWIGFLLTLSAAIARNYNQNYFPSAPHWIITPALLSTATCLLISIFLRISLKLHKGDFKRLLGLLWMTSPIAWLYAIPIESYTSEYTSAMFNIVLLTLVSIWRVLLFAKILQYVSKISYGECFLLTLLPVSIEVFIIGFFGQLPKGLALMGMASLKVNPATELLQGAANFFMRYSMPTALLTFVLLLFVFRRGKKWKDRCSLFNSPVDRSNSAWPKKQIFGLLVAFCACAIPFQIQLGRNEHLDTLVTDEKYGEAMEFLKSQNPSAFAASKILAPDPYSLLVFKALPPMIALLNHETPNWIKEHYLRSAEIMFGHADESFHAWMHTHNHYAELLQNLHQLGDPNNMIGKRKTALLNLCDEIKKKKVEDRFDTSIATQWEKAERLHKNHFLNILVELQIGCLAQ